MKKRALITGVTGMVGSHMADYLLANTDWDIIGQCRWRSSLDNIRHLIPQINSNDRIRLSYADLRDTVSMFNLIEDAQPDYIFHLAAQSNPQTSFSSPLDTYDTNIQGTARLLEAVRKVNINPRIHICASSEVFGRVSVDKLPINEDCSFHPASPYAISKVGTDLIGRYYAEAYDMTIMTTRMFTHTGPRRGDIFAESTFAKQIAMIEAALLPPIVKTGNLESLRTWSDVRDAVRAYYMLVTISPVAGAYYNIGGNFSCSVKDMLNHLLSLSKRKDITIETDTGRMRPIDADLQVPDTSKFYQHTGWAPSIPFETTMLDLLNYWRDKVARGEIYPNR